jgi:uncharacterized membrane protein YdjX (TVP38/TMEM64 family)
MTDKTSETDNNKSKKGLIIGGVIASVLALVALIFLVIIPNWNSISEVFSSTEKFKAWIDSFGVWGPAVFYLLCTVQVVFAPIPGNLTGIAGGAMFGLGWGFLLTYAGILTGSILAYLVGQYGGRRLVVWLIGEEKYKKYTKIFRSDLSWGLFIIFLIPFFPDDILCILAGISPLPLRRFIILVAIGRAPSALFNSAIGAGLLKADDFNIPWWVWALVAAVIVGLGVVYFLNKSKINRWLEQRLGLDADGDGDSDSDNDSNSKEESETEKNLADKNNHQPVIHRMKRTEKSPS